MKIVEKVKIVIATLAVAAMGAVALLPASSAYAANTPPTTGTNSKPGSTSVNATADQAQKYFGENKDGDALPNTVNTIINVMIGVIGFIAVVVIILGGVQYTTSAGDAGKVKKAKDTIMYGIIGLVVALLAFAIVNFILANVFSSK